MKAKKEEKNMFECGTHRYLGRYICVVLKLCVVTFIRKKLFILHFIHGSCIGLFCTVNLIEEDVIALVVSW